jgi:hypothetical protein
MKAKTCGCVANFVQVGTQVLKNNTKDGFHGYGRTKHY